MNSFFDQIHYESSLNQFHFESILGPNSLWIYYWTNFTMISFLDQLHYESILGPISLWIHLWTKFTMNLFLDQFHNENGFKNVQKWIHSEIGPFFHKFTENRVWVQFFSFRTVLILVSKRSTFAERLLWVFWTVHFGPRPPALSRMDRSV